MPTCKTCSLCKNNEAVDKIIHQDKFDQMLNIGEVLERLKKLGFEFSHNNLSHHYNHHLDDSMFAEYKKQVSLIRLASGKNTGNRRKKNGNGNGDKKYTKEELENMKKFAPDSRISFDIIKNLKDIYYEFSSNLDEFRKSEENRVLSQANLRFYSSMVSELRKIISDIMKVEQNREFMKTIMKEELEDSLKIMVKDVAELSNIAKLDDIATERLAKRLSSNVGRAVDKVDKRLKTRLY